MKCRIGIVGEKGGTGICLTPAAPPRTPFALLALVLACLSAFSVCAAPLGDDPPGTGRGSEELEDRARLALGQNVADYLFLGTLNADVQYSVHRSWTLLAGARYNNWTWRHRREDQFESRQQTYYLGARWWPWYTYSGWWAGAKLQYQQYNRGGLLSLETEEGDAVGLSLGGGYCVHVNRSLNVDFGLFYWGGVTRYVKYACPYCGRRIDEGSKTFLLPDEIRIALQFIF
ncbi:MAG: DUF3575 domain-containing protein [Bacteroidales bacterium]|nr:DUF3575 domain-containing protein [Bacteroidales bacterium]